MNSKGYIKTRSGGRYARLDWGRLLKEGSNLARTKRKRGNLGETTEVSKAKRRLAKGTSELSIGESKKPGIFRTLTLMGRFQNAKLCLAKRSLSMGDLSQQSGSLARSLSGLSQVSQKEGGGFTPFESKDVFCVILDRLASLGSPLDIVNVSGVCKRLRGWVSDWALNIRGNEDDPLCVIRLNSKKDYLEFRTYLGVVKEMGMPKLKVDIHSDFLDTLNKSECAEVTKTMQERHERGDFIVINYYDFGKKDVVPCFVSGVEIYGDIKENVIELPGNVKKLGLHVVKGALSFKESGGLERLKVSKIDYNGVLEVPAGVKGIRVVKLKGGLNLNKSKQLVALNCVTNKSNSRVMVPSTVKELNVDCLGNFDIRNATKIEKLAITNIEEDETVTVPGSVTDLEVRFIEGRLDFSKAIGLRKFKSDSNRRNEWIIVPSWVKEVDIYSVLGFDIGYLSDVEVLKIGLTPDRGDIFRKPAYKVPAGVKRLEVDDLDGVDLSEANGLEEIEAEYINRDSEVEIPSSVKRLRVRGYYGDLDLSKAKNLEEVVIDYFHLSGVEIDVPKWVKKFEVVERKEKKKIYLGF